MNENLDLTKILEGCPKGTEFYSTVYGEVTFVEIDSSFIRPIIIRDNFTGSRRNITSAGRALCGCGECTLFPSKDQRDWSKFVRFWEKPKVQKFDLKTLQPFDKILARDYVSGRWSIDFFSYKKDDDCIRGLVYNWYQVIPYNEETKHLLGTKEDCPEYYKWWEK